MSRRRRNRSSVSPIARGTDFPRQFTPVLRLFEDRRLHELGRPSASARPAASFSRHDSTRLVLKQSWQKFPSRYDKFNVSHRIGFKYPADVVMCARRKIRRETLFALGGAGRGIRVSNRRRKTDWSNVEC